MGETFAGLPFEKGVELADALKAFVPAGMSMSAMALRWCLDFDAVSVIIPGARNAEQAVANARADGGVVQLTAPATAENVLAALTGTALTTGQ